MREIRGLERLEFLVQQSAARPGAAGEWRYALVALDDRLRWCRYVASLEHPLAVSMADELVRAQDERAAVSRDGQVASTSQELPDLPKGARVH